MRALSTVGGSVGVTGRYGDSAARGSPAAKTSMEYSSAGDGDRTVGRTPEGLFGGVGYLVGGIGVGGLWLKIGGWKAASTHSLSAGSSGYVPYG